MATRKPEALKQVVIDGEASYVGESSTIADVVAKDVTAVQVIDPAGRTQLVRREQFNQPVPEGFTTYLSDVARGSGRA